MYETLAGFCEGGRRVQNMTNAIESGANPFGCTDYLNEKKNILATGSEVFEVSCGQSLHTKTILVDDHISMIGSYNLDLRSTYLDTELMLVIDSPGAESMPTGKRICQGRAKQTCAARWNRERRAGFQGEMPFYKKAGYFLLRLLTGLFRYLL